LPLPRKGNRKGHAPKGLAPRGCPYDPAPEGDRRGRPCNPGRGDRREEEDIWKPPPVGRRCKKNKFFIAAAKPPQ